MSKKFLRYLPIAAVVMAAPLLFVTESWGDIVKTLDLDGAPSKVERGGESLGPTAPFRVQCWQEGREIIDQRDLYGMSLKSILEQASVSFKRKGSEGFAIHIISVDDTVCLVQANP